MPNLQTLLLPALSAALLSFNSAHAQSTASVVDGNTDFIFNPAGGFALDFDATTGKLGTYSPNLTLGTSYNLNSITIYSGGQQYQNGGGSPDLPAGSSTTPFYLGVYTASSGNTLSGFLGTSTNTQTNEENSTRKALTFNFSGISATADATAGSGSGLLHFAFQTVTTAIPNFTGNNGTGGIAMPLNVFGTQAAGVGIADTFSAILQTDTQLRTNRSAEYSATITPVPEPSAALMLLGGAGMLSVFRRRR